jgi:putative endonuclease
LKNTHAIGALYEQRAVEFLQEKGYGILERNYRCRHGEIDIVARYGKQYVFIEVKYRKDLRKGDPAEAVDFYKQKRIRYMARHYLYSHHIGEEVPCRFDVVAILGQEIRLIENAF